MIRKELYFSTKIIRAKGVNSCVSKHRSWIYANRNTASGSLVSMHSDYTSRRQTRLNRNGVWCVYVRICTHATCLPMMIDICKRRCKWSRGSVVRPSRELLMNYARDKQEKCDVIRSTRKYTFIMENKAKLLQTWMQFSRVCLIKNAKNTLLIHRWKNYLTRKWY